MDIKIILLFLITVLNFFIAALVLSKNFRKGINISYALLVVGISGWALTNALFQITNEQSTGKIYALLSYYSGIFIALPFFYFTLVFPVGYQRLVKRYYYYFISVIGIIWFVILTIPGLTLKTVVYSGTEGKIITGPGLFFHFGAISIFIIWGLINLFQSYKKVRGIARGQIRFVILGGAISAFFGIILNLVLPLFGYYNFVWLGPDFTIFLIICTAYAIVRYRLMDIRLVISRSLLYVLLVAAVTTMFATLTYIILPYFGEQLGVSTFSLIITASFIIVLGLDPLKRILASATDTIFFKDKINYQDVLRKLAECISLEIEFESLIASTLKTLTTELKVSNAQLFFDQRKTEVYTSWIDLSWNNKVVRLKKSRPLVAYLKKYRDLIITEELEREIIDLSDSSRKRKLELIRRELKSLQAALVVPIITEGTLVAILVLGKKRSQDVFNNDDIALMEVFAPQLGTALEKGRLYKEVKDFNIKLKQEVLLATEDLRDKNIELEQRSNYLEALQTITTLVTQVLDFKEVTQMLVDGIVKELGYLGGILLLVDKKTDRIYIEAYTKTPLTEKAAKLLPRPVKQYDAKFSGGNTLSIQAVKTNEVKIGGSFASFVSPPCPKAIAMAMQKLLKIKSVVAVPVVSEDRVVGALLFTVQKQEQQLTEIDLHVMKSLANQTGIIYRNLELLKEIQRANQKLRVANEHLQDLDRAKSEFMSIASHQLRTPLSGIMGYLSMLAEGDYGEIADNQKKVIDELLAASQRLIRMVNLFLNITRIEAGRFKLMRSEVDISELIASEVKELIVPAQKKGIKLEFKKGREKLPTLNIDEDKIKDVVLNLIDNAIKYTEKGKIIVEAVADKDVVTVSVKDAGVGIPKGEANKLFMKFVRGTGIARLSPDGAGLGLFIAKKIIEEHNGKIWVESPGKGKGSTFKFSLPLR